MIEFNDGSCRICDHTILEETEYRCMGCIHAGGLEDHFRQKSMPNQDLLYHMLTKHRDVRYEKKGDCL